MDRRTCSLSGGLGTVKVLILPKLRYGFNTIPDEAPAGFSRRHRQDYFKFTRKGKGTRTAKTTVMAKDEAGGTESLRPSPAMVTHRSRGPSRSRGPAWLRVAGEPVLTERCQRPSAAAVPAARLQAPRAPASHLSEVLLEMPELQALLQFLLMFCPELIKGGLGFIQLGQEPGRGDGSRAGPRRRQAGGALGLPSTREGARHRARGAGVCFPPGPCPCPRRPGTPWVSRSRLGRVVELSLLF